MAGSSREVFDDTILEFMGKMSEANKDDIETTPRAPVPPTLAIGEPHPSFSHATLQNLECLQGNKQL